jgi:hypothetical protein
VAKSIRLGQQQQQQPQPPMPVPPPAAAAPAAAAPPELRNGPPLPLGRAVRIPEGAKLTNFERRHLEAQADVPAGVRTASAEAVAEAGVYRPPVDPNTPPVAFDPIDIARLKPDQQARVHAELAQAQASQPQPQPQPPAATPYQDQPKLLKTKDLGVAAGAPARPATAYVPNTVAPQPAAPATGVPGLDERQAALAAEQAAAVRTEEPVAPVTHCPHCQWDLARRDDPEPEYHEKIAFLQTAQGQKPFLKEYPLMGGAIVLTFRTLHIKEVDAIFQQVYRERDAGEIGTEADYWEAVNRYRLFLQLQRARADGAAGFDKELPDGLSPRHNPRAAAFWEFEAGVAEPLKLIAEYVHDEVLPTESLSRVAQVQCGKFNKLVARLESLMDGNSDFWSRTGGPS